MPVCAACTVDRPKVEYSKAQLGKKASRRCKSCVESDAEAPPQPTQQLALPKPAKLSPQELADAATTKYGMSEKEIQREIQRERQREKDDLGKTRGDSPLLAASANGHPDTLKQLIVAGAQLDSRSRSDGCTAIMRAIASGEENGIARPRGLACVQMLLAAGAPIDSQNHAGHTALHCAFAHKVPEAADILLDAGADARACQSAGRACKKCALNIKIRKRQRAALEKAFAAAEAKKREDTGTVLEEEFGDGDFMKLARSIEDEPLDDEDDGEGGLTAEELAAFAAMHPGGAAGGGPGGGGPGGGLTADELADFLDIED